MTRTTLLLALGGTLLAGCDRLGTTFRSEPINATAVEGKLRGNRPRSERIRAWRDPQTGCQYLVWENRRHGGITPRLARDGRPLCSPG